MAVKDSILSHLNNAQQTARLGGDPTARIQETRDQLLAIAKRLALAWAEADDTTTDAEEALDDLADAVQGAVVQLVGTFPPRAR